MLALLCCSFAMYKLAFPAKAKRSKPSKQTKLLLIILLF